MPGSKLADGCRSSHSCWLLRGLHPGSAFVFVHLVQAGGVGYQGGHILLDDGNSGDHEWPHRLWHPDRFEQRSRLAGVAMDFPR